MSRVGIRARLAAVATLVFALSVISGAFVTMRFVQHRLIANARDNASRVLDTYLTGATIGGPFLATLEPTQAATFFYLGESGTELTSAQYVDVLISAAPGPLGGVASSGIGLQPGVSMSGLEPTTTFVGSDGGPGSVRGAVLAVNVSTARVGSIYAVDRGPGLVAVAQKIQFTDGTVVQVGVQTPTAPVIDGLNTVRLILWIGVPFLIVAVGGLTWLSVGRALRPVHLITGQAHAITASNLSQRVPVPAARDDIAELATTVNEMLGRLETSQHQHRQFVSDAAHELRSPVAASRVQLEVGLLHPASVDWRATAQRVLAEQERLGTLIDDLLALARLDENGVGPLAPVDVVPILQEEMARCARATCWEGPPTAVVLGSGPHLRRALRNVLDNADRYARSCVRVSVVVDATDVLVTVDDDGPGVPEDQRERIFERFTRLDEARGRDSGGGGLGLAIVRQIVDGHGGRVSCGESSTGGAVFPMRLRRGTAAAPDVRREDVPVRELVN